MLVGVAPHPELKGCFVAHTTQDIVFLWALLIIWNARK